MANHLRASQYSPTSSRRKQNCFCRYIVTNKVTLWAPSYSACVVDTKTIIHLSVGESGGYYVCFAITCNQGNRREKPGRQSTINDGGFHGGCWSWLLSIVGSPKEFRRQVRTP